MKTLVEVGVEPCVGMIIQSPTHKRLKHHIIEIEEWKGWHYVISINENGYYSRKWIKDIVNSWFFVGYSKTPFKSLFEVSDFGGEKLNETKKLIKQIEDLWK